MPEAVVAIIASVGEAAAAGATALGASAATATAIGVNVATITAYATIAAGAYGVSQALSGAGQPKKDFGAQYQKKYGAIAPRTIILGRSYTAGIGLTDLMRSGRNNGVGSMVTAVSTGGIRGVIERIKWKNDIVSFGSAVNGIQAATGKYAGKIWLAQKNGDWNQTAIDISAGGNGLEAGAQPSDWGASHRALGCIVAMLCFKLDDDIFKDNFDDAPIFEVFANGNDLIDPRTNAVATTDAQRLNPAVSYYTYALGKQARASVRAFGCGLPEPNIDRAQLSEWANLCDTNSWTLGLELDIDPKNHLDNLNAIAQAGGAIPDLRQGKLSVRFFKQRASVYTITADDLAGDLSIESAFLVKDAINTIVPRFIGVDNAWQIVDGKPIVNSAYLALDGGFEKSKTLTFAGVTNLTQLGQLSAYDVYNSREPIKAKTRLKARALYGFNTGDNVTINIPERGLNAKFSVNRKNTALNDFTFDIDVLSETDAKHAAALSQVAIAPIFDPQAENDPSYVATPETGSWTATNDVISSSGTQLPIIRITGSTDYDAATGIVVEYAPDEIGATYKTLGTFAPTQTEFEIGVVTPNQDYNVRISYINEYGVTGSPLALSTVTTDDLLTGGVTIGAKRDITFNGMLNNTSWQDLAQLDFVGLPICLAEVTNMNAVATAFTGTSADLEFRIMLDGSQVALQASQNAFTGGSPSALDLSDLFLEYTENELSAGNHTFILQARRTAGTGYVTAFSGIFEITTTKKL